MLRVTLALVAASLILASSADSQAKPKSHAKVRRAAPGKIYTSTKSFPKLKDRKIRQKTTKDFWEDEEAQKWTIYFAGVFKRPLNDMEATIKLFDTTGKDYILVASFEQYFMARGSRSISSKIVMKRERFGVNRRILMTVEDYHGRVLAEGSFRIGGKVARRPRVRTVDFTEDEVD